jgi:hypothetical protein
VRTLHHGFGISEEEEARMSKPTSPTGRWHRLKARFREVGRRLATEDDGYTTETAIVTALLAALAIAVIGIIVAKVTGKANSIDLGLDPADPAGTVRAAGAYLAAYWPGR